MNIAIILIILLVGAILTYFSGNKFASKVAILFSTAAAIEVWCGGNRIQCTVDK